MSDQTFGKRPLKRAVFTLSLLLLGAGSWTTSDTSGQEPVARWRPRRVPPGISFVGDQVCAGCHKTKHTSQMQTGMGMAMEAIADSKVLTANPLLTFRIGPYSYEIKRSDKQSIYTVTDGTNTITLPILYAFGQGKAGQTYVLRYKDAFYESQVSYYREVGGLDFTIGALRNIPKSVEAAVGRRLSENEATACFSCHSTGSVIGGQIHLDKVTPGVRCEACHGPGEKHVAAGKLGQPNKNLIFNPGRLSGDQIAQEFCASCHRGNDEFSLLKSMEINNVRFQPYRIFHSKCYSDDRRITCTACHNPHEQIKEDAAHYDSKCVACHNSNEGKGENAAAQAQDQPGVCKVGTKDCTSCHMPKTGPAAAHFKFTDHYIRIVKPEEGYPN